MCVCACVRARARAWVKAYGCVLASVCVCVFFFGSGCGCTSADVCLCPCRLTYVVCHAQAPCCLHPLWLYHIFWHCLINGKIFEKKKVTDQEMRVLIFSTTFIETFLILRTIQ